MKIESNLFSASEAVKSLQEGGVTHQTGATLELVESDVLDHYRTYSLLEKLLHNPPKLAEQLAFQIEPQTRGFLIEKLVRQGCQLKQLFTVSRALIILKQNQSLKKSFHLNSICRYYDFDDAVIRELLGKKLSSRHRKDLDEVSEKTRVQLKSCRYVYSK